uniref:Uncharacterized protein n=1 Tax=Strigamia maritima TaxID=126957 RepID=T1JP12_STRMM
MSNICLYIRQLLQLAGFTNDRIIFRINCLINIDFCPKKTDECFNFSTESRLPKRLIFPLLHILLINLLLLLLIILIHLQNNIQLNPLIPHQRLHHHLIPTPKILLNPLQLPLPLLHPLILHLSLQFLILHFIILQIFLLLRINNLKKLVYPLPTDRRHSHTTQISIKLVQNQTQRAVQTRHITLIAVQRLIERHEISHPRFSELAVLHIRFVENNNKWQPRFIQYTTRVQHIRHECCWSRVALGVHDVDDDRCELRRECFGDNGTGC